MTVSTPIAKMFIKPKASTLSIKGQQHLRLANPYIVPEPRCMFWQQGFSLAPPCILLRYVKPFNLYPEN